VERITLHGSRAEVIAFLVYACTFDFWKTSLISGRLLARCGYKKRSPLYVLRNKKNKKKFKNRCNGVTYVTEGLVGQ
jgi:hypothetical protein